MGCIQFLCGSNLASQALSCQGDNMELKFILFFSYLKKENNKAGQVQLETKRKSTIFGKVSL